MTSSKGMTIAETKDVVGTLARRAAIGHVSMETMAQRIVGLVWTIKGWPNASQKQTAAEFLASLTEE